MNDKHPVETDDGYIPHNHPEFIIFGKDQDSGEKLFELPFHTTRLVDLTPRPDTDKKVFGESYFGPGDRVGYHTAYCFWRHLDPDHHPFLDTGRVLVQDIPQPGIRLQINDRAMPELGEGLSHIYPHQGREPYPYEHSGPTRAPVLDFPDAQTMLLIHDRKVTTVSKMSKGQVLQAYTIPEAMHPDADWFYQGGGEWVLVYKDRPVCRIIITTFHPAYSLIVPGMGNNQFLEEQWETLQRGELPRWYP